MPMKSLVLLVALVGWPSFVPAYPYPSKIVTPDEEKNLNHYVQVLQNLVLSVPTRRPGRERITKSPNNVHSARTRVSPYKELISHARVSTEDDIFSFPTSGKTTRLPTRDLQLETTRGKHVTRTPFWSIKPNNVSVVLTTKEPYIEKEPEPEPRTEAPMSWPSITESPPSLSSRFTEWDTSTKLEDVPHLSEEYEIPVIESQPLILSNEEILNKISDIRSEVQHVPLAQSIEPEFREDIQASRESLKRSLALAEAADHRLQKMYRSQLLPLGHSGFQSDNIETVINVLYNSRYRLSQYLDIKYVPPEMRQKATTVIHTLKSTLCISHLETQNLIRKLLNNNIKILNLLDIP